MILFEANWNVSQSYEYVYTQWYFNFKLSCLHVLNIWEILSLVHLQLNTVTVCCKQVISFNTIFSVTPWEMSPFYNTKTIVHLTI